LIAGPVGVAEAELEEAEVVVLDEVVLLDTTVDDET